MNPNGGSELALANLYNHVPEDKLRDFNFQVNLGNYDCLRDDKINILWNQINIDQASVETFINDRYLNKIDYIVYVSHWQYEKFRYRFPIPEQKSVVIKNAVLEIPFAIKPKKIKLIYTSTPWRGLDVLLDAFELLDRDDVELDIYSSTIIYGSDFYDKANLSFVELFDRASKMKNVNYFGYASNSDVRYALQQAHIFAYPCTWEETSCMSAIEAGMAGLSIVTTNLGALFETLSEWPTYVCWETNRANLTKKFAHELNLAIEDYWLESTQLRLSKQQDFFCRFWSWEARAKNWISFLDSATARKTLIKK